MRAKAVHQHEITAPKVRILILADLYKNTAQTVWDHCLSFRRFTKHKVHYLNPVWNKMPCWLDFAAYDVLIIHYSVFCLHESYLSATWRQAIANASILKIQFIQDEYRYVNLAHRFLEECGIDILYTCIPEAEIEKVYSKKKLPNLQKVNTLTGYVPDYLKHRTYMIDANRSIDVGYRARGEGFWWLGKLYQEKIAIGQGFLKRSKPYHMKCDISNKEKDRIYGTKWLEFLQDCKATLGTESGASIIDWDGLVEQDVLKYCHKNPGATFAEVQKAVLRRHEGKVKMNQISPRVFEAIGCGTLLILFKGNYSGILVPYVHYVPLEKNFSNIAQVIAVLRNEPKRKKIVEQAYTDIIASNKYSYETFIRDFDAYLTRNLKNVTRDHKKARVHRVSPLLLPWTDPYINILDPTDPKAFRSLPAKLKLASKRAFPSNTRAYAFGKFMWRQLRRYRQAYRIWRENVFRNRWFWREKPKIILHVLIYVVWRRHVQHSRNN